MFKISPYLSSSLNFFRWLSAFFVVIGHIRSILWIDYDKIIAKNILLQTVYFLTGLGHQAVIIFFVLSGFLVGGSVIRNFKADNFKPVQYLINRISRLYVVLLVALPLGYLFDYVGTRWFNEMGIYTHKIFIVSMNYRVTERLDKITFLMNLLMNQTIHATTLGSNGPLWSLANEFWYYLLFPVILGIGSAVTTSRQKVICFIGLIILYWFLPPRMILYFTIWLAGCMISLINKPLVPNKYIAIGFFMIILISTKMQVVYSHAGEFVCDGILTFAFCLVINSLCFIEKQTTDKKENKINEELSAFSYTLYLVHHPFLVLIVAVIYQTMQVGVKMQPTFLSALIFICLLVLIYLFAWLISLVTEKQTPLFKAYLMRIF